MKHTHWLFYFYLLPYPLLYFLRIPGLSFFVPFMMAGKLWVAAFLVAGSVSLPSSFPRDDYDTQVASIVNSAKIPAYKAPAANFEITEWLAIGDSFSA